MTDYADEFPLAPGLAYLNHAAVAPWPRRAAAAVERFAEENLHHGARHYPDWLAVEQRLRERLARLLNAPSPDDIALLKNTSEGLSVVAHRQPCPLPFGKYGSRSRFSLAGRVARELRNS